MAIRSGCRALSRMRTVAYGIFLLLVLLPGQIFSQDVVALTEQGLELMRQGRYRDAETALVEALKLAGPGNPTALYNVASVYHRQGRLQEAERFHRLALQEIERLHGPFDIQVAQSLNDLGAIYRSTGRYSQAVAVLERGAEILDRNPSDGLGPTLLNNLGLTYYEIGQSAKAEAILQSALAHAESGQEQAQSEIPYILNSLGRMYLERKRYAEAETAYRRAVTILAGTVGSEHPDYAVAQSNLGIAYQRQKRPWRRVLSSKGLSEILEREVGREAPVLVAPLESYAAVLKALGRKSESEEISRRARSIVRPGAGTVDVKSLKKR